jgi:RNA recognition motif-containing protein
MTQEDGRSKGCGIVQYQNSRDAARAVRELQNTDLQGRPIFVREDREQGGKRGGGNRRGGDRKTGGGRGEASSGGDANGRQLFVGNLSYDTSWMDLKDHFRQCGDVERVEVIEGPGGRKKGFGTVRFFKEEDATEAISQLDGVELEGRELKVRLDEKAR